MTPFRLSAVALLLLVTTVARGREDPAPDPVTADERAEVVERLGAMLVERYVFPDVGAQCAKHLRAELDAGRFDDASDQDDFAARLTAAVQSISRDKHLRVQVPAPERARTQQENPALARLRRLARERERNFGFERVERLEGNVGYLDLRYFSGAPQASETAIAAMNFLANSDAVIFDMRQNGGGFPGTIRFITSWLFDEPTHLNSLYFREGDRTDEFWTFADVPGTKFPDVPVFVLTSDFTFSGAEEFTYNLQARKRATIVGETTGGGANPGGFMPITDRFSVFISTGRAINPITGTNWEGTGVVPDVAVAADEAYDTAIELAAKAAETHRREEIAALEAAFHAYEADRVRALALHEAGQHDDAREAIVAAVTTGHGAGLLAEPDVNMLGYELLGQEHHALAIAVFRFNVDAYPESSNVYDSLGEAYMNDGQIERAIEHYERSLELDPRNENAKAMIERMRAPLAR